MCGRYALGKGADVVVNEFDLFREDIEWEPVFSVAPRTLAPIIRARAAGADPAAHREVTFARWGLQPAWAKEGGPAPINARLETVATNGMFRSAFSSGRAIIPMTGYYEWQEGHKEGKKVKLPSYVHGDGGVLGAAGLVAARKVPARDDSRGEVAGGRPAGTSGADEDEWQLTFTIITRTGIDAAGEVHERMPVFLPPGVWDEWLVPGKLDDKEGMTALLDAESEGAAASLSAHRVSRRVNNVRTLDRRDPTLIDLVD